MVFLLRCVVDEIGDNKRRNYCQNGSPEKLTKVIFVRTNYILIKVALRPLPLLRKIVITELGNITDSPQCVWNPGYN